jgi:hypothetical protein
VITPEWSHAFKHIKYCILSLFRRRRRGVIAAPVILNTLSGSSDIAAVE